MGIIADNNKELYKRLRDGIMKCAHIINRSKIYEEAKMFYSDDVCPLCGNKLSNMSIYVLDAKHLYCNHCQKSFTKWTRSGKITEN